MFDFKNVDFVLRNEEQKPMFYYSEISNDERRNQNPNSNFNAFAKS